MHIVFPTKNRDAFLSERIRMDVFRHIINYCKQKNIFLKSINGHKEHVHCLISLGKDQSISKVAQLIKGESSYWINKTHLISEKFTWQDDYFAVSVSESNVETVNKYIDNQTKHHNKVSFTEEVQEFINKYGFEIRND